MFKYPKTLFCILLFIMACPLVGIGQVLTPTIPQWINDIGGTAGTSTVIAQKLDASNNVYVTGYFSGTVDFDPSATTYPLTSLGGTDCYVAKYDATGAFKWAVSFGGINDDQANDLDIDASGSVAITGQYSSPTMNVGNTTLTNAGGTDIFLVNLDATRGNFLWSTTIGGLGADMGNRVAIDATGSRIIGAQYQSTITVGTTHTYTATGTYNGLVVKYDINGGYKWALNLGATGDNGVHNVGVDAANNVIVEGAFSGTVNFNPLFTAKNLTATGTSSYIAKYSSEGSYDWLQPITGTIVNDNTGMYVNKNNNNIYLTGPFTGSLAFGSTTFTATGGQDAFLARYDATGVRQFAEDIARGVNAASVTTSTGITVGNDGNIYVTGYFSGEANFHPTQTVNLQYHGQQDLFIAKYTSGGLIPGDFWWATNIGNGNLPANVAGRAVSLDNSGNIILAGSFSSTLNFDFTGCTTSTKTAQSTISDGFIAKYIVGAAAAQNNVITAPPTTLYCGGNPMGPITGTAAFGGAITAQYQWQQSPDGVNFTDITGATGQDLGLGPYHSTTYYRRSATSGACFLPVFSNVVLITLQPILANNLITAPAVTIFCVSGDPAIINGTTPTGGDGVNYTYQWQISVDGITFVNISGATSANYDPPAITASRYYQRLVTSGSCTIPFASNIVFIQVQQALSNNIITTPSVTFFCATGDPDPITGNTPIGGSGTYTYQWQSSADNVTFTDIAGETSINFDPPVITATTYYRRVAISGVCTTPYSSNVITITVQPLIVNIVAPPAVANFCLTGNPANLVGAVPTGGNGTYTYQWQVSTDNVTFSNIAGQISKDYDPPVLNNITYYRRKVTSGTCFTVSNVITIVIETPILNNTITAPLAFAACTVTGGTPTGGNGIYAYQWLSSTDDVTFIAIAGETAKDYSPPLNSATMYYRRIVMSGTCFPATTSNTAMIMGFTPIVNNAVTSASSFICGPGIPDVITGSAPSGGAGTYVYQWQSSTDGVTFADITGASSVNYNPAIISATTYYRRVVMSGVCLAPNVSDAVTITVIQPPANVNAGKDASIIAGQTVQLNGTATGDNLKYSWSPAIYLDNPNILNPIAKPDKSIVYTLTVTAANNCFIVNDDVSINVFFGFVANNTFTPNGDGINDTWELPALAAYPNCQVLVFNRYGALIFKSTGYPKPWDGNYGNKQLPAGTYYYTVDLKDGSKMISGWVAIVR